MPTARIRNQNYRILQHMESLRRQNFLDALVLGGSSGSGGGVGGPPGGFIGQLPQRQVTYDTSEAVHVDNSGSAAIGFMSLVDNLNTIRGRLSTVAYFYNRSGGALVEGDVVVLDTANAESVKTTTVADDVDVWGVARTTISSGSLGLFTVGGYARTVKVTGSTSIGNYLYTSTTAKKAAPSTSRVRDGLLGRAITSGSITVAAMIYATQHSGSAPLSSGSIIGHVIRENGTNLPARSNLNFVDGIIAADDAGSNETDVNLDYATVTQLADVAAAEVAGTSATVPRGDHIHAHGSGYLIDAHHARDHAGAHVATGADPLIGVLNANARVAVRKNSGAVVGTRRRLNLIEGPNMTLTVADDSTDEEVDITISTGSGGAGATHNILSSTHFDTIPATVVQGDLITGGSEATPRWMRLALGATGQVAKSLSAMVQWGFVAFSELTGTLSNTQHGTRSPPADHSGSLSANARVIVRVNTGANAGTRRRINLIQGANISISAADDAANEEVDVTIQSSGSITGTVRQQALFTMEGALTTGVKPLRIYNNFGATKTFVKAFLSVNTAPTGADVIVDLDRDGATIFSDQANRPRILAGAFTGFTVTFNTTSWPDGSYLQFSIDQIGSTGAGADLTVHIAFE